MSLEEIAEFAQAFSPSRRTVLAMLLAGSGGLTGRGPGEARKGRMGPDCGKQARKRCRRCPVPQALPAQLPTRTGSVRSSGNLLRYVLSGWPVALPAGAPELARMTFLAREGVTEAHPTP